MGEGPVQLHAPEDVPRAFAEAWNRGDADSIAALFAADADFVNVVGFWWTRREQIRHNHAYGFEKIFAGSTMTLDRVRVRDLEDTAVVHARWRVAGQSRPAGDGREAPAGTAGRMPTGDLGGEPVPRQEQPGERRGIFTFVVHRQEDGRWLTVAAQNTDIIPGAQTLLDDGSGLHPAHYERRPAHYEPMRTEPGTG
ncbi:YybH family protein [Ornithinimicrobium ciconiae]|uniref:YybH family protein n=1 Tax=Ornithinimicrobium ciconiae TaxID=2594265 RepID=UPI001D17D713|nr:SgcJ/EcaC family oxidoreductase [Ornithinimicrobium ciconiae]